MIQAFEQLKEQYLQIGEERGEERGIKIGKEQGILIGEERGEERGIKIGKEQGILIGEERGEERGIKIGEIKGILQTMQEYGSTKENAIQKVIRRYPDYEEMIIQLADEIYAS